MSSLHRIRICCVFRAVCRQCNFILHYTRLFSLFGLPTFSNSFVFARKNRKSLSASLIFAEARSPHIIKFSSLSLSHGFCANETRKRKKTRRINARQGKLFFNFYCTTDDDDDSKKNSRTTRQNQNIHELQMKTSANVTERSCVSIRFDIRPFAKKYKRKIVRFTNFYLIWYIHPLLLVFTIFTLLQRPRI